MDACIGIIVYFCVGYTVAYGTEEDSNVFIGEGNAALNENEDWNSFFFQWAFAATAATIVSGSVAERCSVFGYFAYTFAITAFVYPVVAHWIWDSHGWLSAFNNDPTVTGGIIDFAGSGLCVCVCVCVSVSLFVFVFFFSILGVVHMVGGFSGLMGALVLGPRLGRFEAVTDNLKYDDSLSHQHKFGSDVPLQVIGMFILWFGWYGFNR